MEPRSRLSWKEELARSNNPAFCQYYDTAKYYQAYQPRSRSLPIQTLFKPVQ